MYVVLLVLVLFFFFQAEDGIRDLVRSRGLGDVYKRQVLSSGRSYIQKASPRAKKLRERSDSLVDKPSIPLSLIHI